MGYYKNLSIELMEERGYYCPACGAELLLGVRHSCPRQSDASDNTVFTPEGDPVRILGTDPRSEQALAYQKWIEGQSMGMYEGQDYPTIEEMTWEEPEEVRAMRQEQAAQLAAMSDEERQAWLDEQNEEAGRRFDARGGRW